MNILSTLYANLYHDRIKEGLSVSGSPVTGNMVLTCCLTMALLSSFFVIYLLFPSIADTTEGFLKSIFGRGLGRTIGRIMAILLVLIIYPIVSYTIGSQANYDKTISTYESFSVARKNQIAKRGGLFMYCTLGVIVIPILLSVLGF